MVIAAVSQLQGFKVTVTAGSSAGRPPAAPTTVPVTSSYLVFSLSFHHTVGTPGASRTTPRLVYQAGTFLPAPARREPDFNKRRRRNHRSQSNKRKDVNLVIPILSLRN